MPRTTCSHAFTLWLKARASKPGPGAGAGGAHQAAQTAVRTLGEATSTAMRMIFRPPGLASMAVSSAASHRVSERCVRDLSSARTRRTP